MSYQVLARKWRPKNFTELLGQEHVVTVLSNALTQQRLHHAYLFTGTRGVGKTTVARIFAKSLNCEQGITAQPCGICDACTDIDQGRFVDLLEIDAASRTKVDDTREILDNVQYAPTRGRFKVYLIDEVHMLSKSSFNALLKTLEEPPEHVKFILATTDPQKLPVTVLSRCLQFHLKALTVKEIDRQLKHILDAEQVTYEPLAINLLAKAARGSVRDSLSLTDQAIAQGNSNITAQNVQQMLGGVDHNWVYKILIALIKQDSKALMELSLDIASYSPNYGRLMAEFIQLLHQIAMAQVVDTHFDLTPEHNLLLEKFAQALSPEDVQLYYQIVLAGRKDLPYAADEQAAFDMVLLRLLAFKPQITADNSTNTSVESNVDFNDIQLVETLNNKAKAKVPPIVENNNTLNDESDCQQEVRLSKELVETEELASQLVSEAIPKENEASTVYSSGIDPVSSSKLGTLDNDLSNTDEVTAKESINEITRVKAIESVAEKVSQSIEQQVVEQPVANEKPLSNDHQINTVIANRNMLRSRKKAMEDSGKKSNDAEPRQPEVITKNKPVDVPDISTISDQPFVEEVIDPSKVKKANQVDKWANMIDAMALNGRLRQLALNATIEPTSTDEAITLLLNQSTKHLKSEVAHQQLQSFVSEYFDKEMQVDIKIVEQTIDDPSQIQGKINDKRYEYAKELLQNDDVVISLQQQFSAQLVEESIEAK